MSGRFKFLFIFSLLSQSIASAQNPSSQGSTSPRWGTLPSLAVSERSPVAWGYQIRSTLLEEDSPSKLRPGQAHPCVNSLMDSLPQAAEAPRVRELVRRYIEDRRQLEERHEGQARTLDLQVEFSLERDFKVPEQKPSHIVFRLKELDAEGSSPSPAFAQPFFWRERIYRPGGGVDLSKCRVTAEDLRALLEQKHGELRRHLEERYPASMPGLHGDGFKKSQEKSIRWAPGWR